MTTQSQTKALTLAREGVEIHSLNSPEYIVCAALIQALEQTKHNPVGFYDAENKDLRHEIPMGEDGDWWQPLYTHPPVPTAQPKPMTDDEIWKNDGIMSANSGYGASFETLREVVRAIEAAHGIKEKNQ